MHVLATEVSYFLVELFLRTANLCNGGLYWSFSYDPIQ